MELPNGFKKVKNIDFELIYEIPNTIQIKESYKYSLEILDDVMF